MERLINSAGLDIIKRFEGCKLTAYHDVAGIWTIGYGHIKGVYPGLVWTQEQADQALEDDLTGTEMAVESACRGVPTADNEMSAMISLAFNIGTGALRGSTLLAKHRAGDRDGAAHEFLNWNKARVNGVLQPVNGLTRRRIAEFYLYQEE